MPYPRSIIHCWFSISAVEDDALAVRYNKASGVSLTVGAEQWVSKTPLLLRGRHCCRSYENSLINQRCLRHHQCRISGVWDTADKKKHWCKPWIGKAYCHLQWDSSLENMYILVCILWIWISAAIDNVDSCYFVHISTKLKTNSK